MEVELTRELEDWIDRQVKSGRYTSASEVIMEAVRLRQDLPRLTRPSSPKPTWSPLVPTREVDWEERAERDRAMERVRRITDRLGREAQAGP